MISITSRRTRFIVLCLTAAGFIFLQNLSAQQTLKGTIRGKVIDDSTRAPISLVNIFIANSTIGAFTDSSGRFQIKDVPYGIHKVVASIVGYTPQIVTVSITDTSVKNLVIRLKLQNIQMSSVNIEGNEPKEWKRHLQKFMDDFFGSTSNAKECTLSNPEVLDFSEDEKTSEFSATVRAPLIIENHALGYRLSYFLKYFKKAGKKLQFYGEAKFDQLNPQNADERVRWKENRKETYDGSRRHFFSTLFHKTSKENGFKVTGVSDVKNQRPDFYKIETGSYINISGSYRIEERVDPEDLVTDGVSLYEKELSFAGSLQVAFNKGLFDSQISQVQLEQHSVTIYSNGEIADPLGVLTSGYWSTQRAAELLPWDYEP